MRQHARTAISALGTFALVALGVTCLLVVGMIALAVALGKGYGP